MVSALESYRRRATQLAKALSSGAIEMVSLDHAELKKFRVFIHSDENAWQRFLGWQDRTLHAKTTRDHLDQWYFTQGKHTYSFLAKIVGEDRYVGWLTINSAETRPELQIGYFILPSERNKGLATQIVNQTILACENHPHMLPWKNIIAGVEEDNAASMSVLKKAGFIESKEDNVIVGNQDLQLVMFRRSLDKAADLHKKVVRDGVAR